MPEPRRHLACRCLDLDPGHLDACDLDTRDLYGVHMDARHMVAC